MQLLFSPCQHFFPSEDSYGVRHVRQRAARRGTLLVTEIMWEGIVKALDRYENIARRLERQ